MQLFSPNRALRMVGVGRDNASDCGNGAQLRVVQCHAGWAHGSDLLRYFNILPWS